VEDTSVRFQNINACLVHESLECVVDLVRNLRYLDPSSIILLYNGGTDPDLLTSGFPFEKYGAIIHPSPKPLSWGYLHDFALDCGRYAREHLQFDTLTVVDSDQLATRPGYTLALASFLKDKPNTGMLASIRGPLPPDSTIAPLHNARAEIDLWRPFFERFPNSVSQFDYWSFWPATVFTRDALFDLIDLFDHDAELGSILKQSHIWATEEVLLPTLTALLGYDVLETPFCHDYVKYRVLFDVGQIDQSLVEPSCFWIHPVPRQYGGGRRRYIRERLGHYVAGATKAMETFVHSQQETEDLASSIYLQIEAIAGWLSRVETHLLVSVTNALIRNCPDPTIVEVGSYCGRSTVALASVAKTLASAARIYAVDPHEGRLGALDREIEFFPASRDTLISNLETAGVSHFVTLLECSSSNVVWDKKIDFLLVDGLHDYFHVASDFHRFEPWLAPISIVAFHDYASYFPGVVAFVNELLADSQFACIGTSESLIVLQRSAKS
jgi:predicted O-methyltransferase YrrM